MLVVVINNYDISFINRIRSILSYIDAIEVRFDYWEKLNILKIKSLQKLLPIPMIFTLRNSKQGGIFQGSEDQRLREIYKLASLNPSYLDIEYSTSTDFIYSILNSYPDIKLIGSYHNFIKTPSNLNRILNLLKKKPFHIYKIVTNANNTLDALRMLTFIKRKSKSHNLIGICMGDLGQVTRILGKIVGNIFDYASLDDDHKSAPGQINIDVLLKQYNYKNLSSNTDIYGLLGDPIKYSVGEVFHNKAFQLLKKDAVYVKLKINKQELNQALIYLKKLPFKGFSITMPLKELIYRLVDYVDEDAKNIQAINSIIVIKKQYFGFNTDGKGAVASIHTETNLTNKKVLILGAGGAAKAIVYEISKLGVEIVILNRTVEKATEISNLYHCSSCALNRLEKIARQGYDIIINTIPEHAYISGFFVDKNSILPNCYAMDINYHPTRETTFLQMSKDKKSNCINGYSMFVNQAIFQLSNWFNVSPIHIKSIILNANFELKDYIS